jgi:hypothetical protein
MTRIRSASRSGVATGILPARGSEVLVEALLVETKKFLGIERTPTVGKDVVVTVSKKAAVHLVFGTAQIYATDEAAKFVEANGASPLQQALPQTGSQLASRLYTIYTVANKKSKY